MSRDYIWKDILVERASQDFKHGGVSNDNRNTLADWQNWIRRHVDKASRPNLPYSPRYQLVRIAALAVAAIEAYDRNNGFPK
jgi:hypothetical protein